MLLNNNVQFAFVTIVRIRSSIIIYVWKIYTRLRVYSRWNKNAILTSFHVRVFITQTAPRQNGRRACHGEAEFHKIAGYNYNNVIKLNAIFRARMDTMCALYSTCAHAFKINQILPSSHTFLSTLEIPTNKTIWSRFGFREDGIQYSHSVYKLRNSRC